MTEKKQSKRRIPKHIEVVGYRFVSDANIFSAKISNDIVQCVNYWPLGSALQIEIISTPTKSFEVVFSQGGAEFPGWMDDLGDILSTFCTYQPLSISNYKNLFRSAAPRDVYELVPVSDVVHFMPQDFKINRDVNRFEYDMLSPNVADEIQASYNRTRRVMPELRIIDIAELIHKLTKSPGTIMRTLISPVDAQVAQETRNIAMRDDIHGSHGGDLNRTVVNARCFIGSVDAVSGGLKRVVTNLSTNSTMTKLADQEVKGIWKSPTDHLDGYAKISLTAASLIRLPALDESNEKSTDASLDNIKALFDLNEEFRRELKEEVQKKVQKMLSEYEGQIQDIIKREVKQLQSESLFVAVQSMFESGELSKYLKDHLLENAPVVVSDFNLSLSKNSFSKNEHSSSSIPPITSG
ncbi:MAG: hypothetical protein LBP35_01470 [Candidatus Ancillula trichonymphae]|jgi:hypothetical protein|nr:hypothetical protein [Candidatus Ancillula trichonymphae]